MISLRACLAFVLMLSPTHPLVAQDRCADHTIRTTGVGVLRLGQTVTAVRQVCRIVQDTIAHKGEGAPGRMLTVMIGTDTILAHVELGRVWRFDVASPAFATVDSLHVGTPLHSLLRFTGTHGTAGEGWLFVFIPSKCGFSFGMRTDRSFDTWDLRADVLQTLPTTMRVEEIWVHKCPRLG